MSAILTKPAFFHAKLNALLELDQSDRLKQVALGQALEWQRRYPGQIKVLDGPPQDGLRFIGTMEEWREMSFASSGLRRI